MKLTQELIDRLTASVHDALAGALRDGKEVDFTVEGDLYEWEHEGYKRRVLDGSRRIVLSIPRDPFEKIFKKIADQEPATERDADRLRLKLKRAYETSQVP